MAAYAILVGFKAGKPIAIAVEEPTSAKVAFKAEVSKGGDCKFDSIELVDTRQGRVKRWRNTKPSPEQPASKGK